MKTQVSLHRGGIAASPFRGQFPVKDTGEACFAGMRQIVSPDGYGVYDMAGNIWQWCLDWSRPDYCKQLANARSVARNPEGAKIPFDPSEPGV